MNYYFIVSLDYLIKSFRHFTQYSNPSETFESKCFGVFCIFGRLFCFFLSRINFNFFDSQWWSFIKSNECSIWRYWIQQFCFKMWNLNSLVDLLVSYILCTENFGIFLCFLFTYFCWFQTNILLLFALYFDFCFIFSWKASSLELESWFWVNLDDFLFFLNRIIYLSPKVIFG